MEGEWISLDQNVIDRPRRGRFQGMEIEVELSPYELPEAVRGYLTDDEKTFIIEFKYLAGAEATVPQSAIDSVVIHLGRTSKRLYKIEIGTDVWAGAAHGVRFRMAQAIEALENDPSRNLRKGNYEVAREVILGQPELVPA